jgi:AcrR family transcriptional regulator
MFETKTRKARQREEREYLILQTAARLLSRDGFQDLNLDELAAAVEYSKGTLYLHFKTKEDLVLAVASHALKHRNNLLEKAAKFAGTTRERARAMGFACCEFAVAHPEFFAVEMMLQQISFWDRVSEARQNEHLEETRRLYHLVNQVVQDAVACGDLPKTVSPNDVTLSMMSITMGSHCLVTQTQLQTLFDIRLPFSVLLTHQDRMLDGWGWKPLSKGDTHTSLDQRISQELFPQAIEYTHQQKPHEKTN